MTFHADVPQHAEMAARLAPIRAHFVSTLVERQTRLSNFLSSTADDATNAAILRALQEDAHKIRGVALTLGFESLGRIASRVDERLDVDVQPEAADQGLRCDLAELLAEIERTITSGVRD